MSRRSLHGADSAAEKFRGREPERRHLTVMFCDLAESTALSQRLDPEDLRDVLRSFQDTCTAIIKRYEGHVSRYMGDGILVLFGYPAAHENDAERAVHAGLDIVEAVAASDGPINEDLPLAVRVGIATGLVVAGDLIGEGASEEEAVVGKTPNLANRLQGLAEPNAVVISAETRNLLGDAFEYHFLGSRDL
jgi:class 3 adenylate cyclase